MDIGIFLKSTCIINQALKIMSFQCSSGHDLSFTSSRVPTRSPVQSRAETNIFVFCFLGCFWFSS